MSRSFGKTCYKNDNVPLALTEKVIYVQFIVTKNEENSVKDFSCADIVSVSYL